MRPRSFDYYSVSSLEEALNLLRSKEEPKILAGGQSLVALMKFRLVSPKTLIDINNVKDLNYIREVAGVIAIGALTRHDQLENSSLIRQKLYLLSEAASVIADQQVRNRGTIGGSLAHADPTADLPAVMVAADANVVTVGLGDSRSYRCDDFFEDYFTTSLPPDRIIREVRVPIPPPGTGGAYLKLSRRHGDFAIVGAAAMVTIDKDGACTKASVVLGGVAATPQHAIRTEQGLVGRRLDDKTIQDAAEKASDGLKPPSDVHASSEYRLEMTRVMAKRALKLALSRAG